jgi:hypothetical protein
VVAVTSIICDTEISSESIRSQLTPAENSSMPIVSVEDFFSCKQSLPLPNHSLEQSPCRPIIGSKSGFVKRSANDLRMAIRSQNKKLVFFDVEWLGMH